MAHRPQVHELAAVAAEEIVLPLLAPDDELEVGTRAQVPAHLEEHDVVELVVAPAAALPEIRELRGVLPVGEEAAPPGRLGVVLEAEVGREGELGLARAPGEVVQALAVHPALALREGRGQPLRAQGAKEPVVRPRFPRHHRHGLATLRLRALADHLPGDDEVEAALLHPLPRPADHEGLAVETRVEVRAVAVLRVEDDPLVLLDHVDEVELDPELLRDPERVVPGVAAALPVRAPADRVGVPLDAEAGEEVDALDVDPLVEDGPRREHRVEPAGDEGDRLAARPRRRFRPVHVYVQVRYAHGRTDRPAARKGGAPLRRLSRELPCECTFTACVTFRGREVAIRARRARPPARAAAPGAHAPHRP